MAKHYFATDGNYGDAEDIIIVDTDSFSDEIWEAIDAYSDYSRPEFVALVVKLIDHYSMEQITEAYVTDDEEGLEQLAEQIGKDTA